MLFRVLLLDEKYNLVPETPDPGFLRNFIVNSAEHVI